ncbi:RNA dependent RNA polymerase [Picobirnavirus Equ4]|nr:RNA dependent RNA polymerase [Picobirnavirus Equ4]
MERKLSQFLKRQLKPYRHDITTPLGDHHPEMLSEVKDMLSAIEVKYPSLYAYEMEMASKVGPLSARKSLKDRMPDILEYYKGIDAAQEPIEPEAIEATSKFFNIHNLHLYSPEQAYANMPHQTNSGYPNWTKRYKAYELEFPISLSDNGTIRSNGEIVNDYPAILGWRGQEGGPSLDDTKQRCLFMFPFTYNVLEAQFYQPFTIAAQVNGTVPPWNGRHEVDVGVTRLFRSTKDPIMCTDFSGYDQHFGKSVQDATRTLIASTLRDDEYSRLWLNYIFPIKYNIPLMISTRRTLTGSHGLGSGSSGTSGDGTIGHKILQFEAALRNGANLNPNSMVLGDDGIITFKGISAKKVMYSYTNHGMRMNSDKQSISDEYVIFLRRWHSKRYRSASGLNVGVYPVTRAIGRLMHVERPTDKWTREDHIMRTLSICENFKYHPLRSEVLRYIIQKDKFRLGLDIPGFIEGLKYKSTSDVLQYLNYNQQLEYASSHTGITSWWCIKELISML